MFVCDYENSDEQKLRINLEPIITSMGLYVDKPTELELKLDKNKLETFYTKLLAIGYHCCNTPF